MSYIYNTHKQITDYKATKKNGFALTINDENIEWVKGRFDASTGEIIKDSWIEEPQPEETYIIKALPLFKCEAGEEFYGLFMPPLSYLNGWEEYPDEISKSAIIRCCFEELLVEKIKHSWIKVKILEVIPLQEISGILPAVQYDKSVDWNTEQYEDKLEYGCWKYYSWNCQSDVGGWCLIHIDEAGVHHLVLASDWLMSETNTYCGNIILHNELKNTSREEINKEQIHI